MLVKWPGAAVLAIKATGNSKASATAPTGPLLPRFPAFLFFGHAQECLRHLDEARFVRCIEPLGNTQALRGILAILFG